MSLTSHLDDKQSPIWQYMHTEFPNTKIALRDSRKQLQMSSAVLPDLPVKYNYSTIGTAIDYRIRYYFSVTPFQDLTASQGAQSFLDALPNEYAAEYGDTLAHFQRSLESLLYSDRPVGNRLSLDKEDTLNRHCYVLALLEQIYRNKFLIIDSPLRESDSVSRWLDIADDQHISDIRNLSWQFYDKYSHLLGLPHILNPQFDGSEEVGGADADLIMDGTLIEIKTTKESRIRYEYVYQLLGYVLLDYSDKYRIESIGLYMARQALLLIWDLESLIRELSSLDTPVNLRERRRQFHAIAKQLG